MAPVGYGIWTALKSNPVLQWFAGIGAAIIAFFLWLASHDRRIRREERRKIRVESLKQVEKIKQESHEKSEQVNIARRDAPRGVLHASELSDRQYRHIFGYSKNSKAN